MFLIYVVATLWLFVSTWGCIFPIIIKKFTIDRITLSAATYILGLLPFSIALFDWISYSFLPLQLLNTKPIAKISSGRPAQMTWKHSSKWLRAMKVAISHGVLVTFLVANLKYWQKQPKGRKDFSLVS